MASSIIEKSLASEVNTLNNQMIQAGQVTFASVTAGTLAQETVTLPYNFQNFSDYVVVATVEIYSNPSMFSVLIRDQTARNFTIRLVAGVDTQNVKVNWIAMRITS